MSNIFNSDLWQIAGSVVLNSLWLGALLAILFWLLIKTLQKSTAMLRYHLAWAFLLLFTAGNIYFGYEAIRGNKANMALKATSGEYIFSINNFDSIDGQDPGANIFSWLWDRIEYLETYKAHVGLVWWVGMLVLSLRFLGGCFYIQKLKHDRAKPVGGPWQQKLQKLAKNVGIKEDVLLLESPLVGGPLTIGNWRPVILLPLGLLSTIPTAQIEAVLLHELYHIRHRDYMINIFQTCIGIAFFYHPLVWWLSNIIREEREHLCDDATVSLSGDSMALARALTYMRELQLTPKTNIAMSLTEKEPRLSSRIYRLFEPRQHVSYSIRGLLSLCFILAFSSAFALFQVPLPQDVIEAPLVPLVEEAGILSLKEIPMTGPVVEVPAVTPPGPVEMEEPIAKPAHAPKVLVAPLEQDSSKITDSFSLSDDGAKMKVTSISDPIYIKNGKKISKEELENISPNDIGSMEVWKSEAATKRYGNDAKEGVIIIYTKDYTGERKSFADEENFTHIITGKSESGIILELNDPGINSDSSGAKNKDGASGKNNKEGIQTSDGSNILINGIGQNNKKPLYILNGEVLEIGADADTPIEVKNMDQNLIYEVNVLKGKAAVEEYGEKGANGVIIIKTKDFVEEEDK